MNILSMYSLSDSQAVPAVGGVAGLGEAGVAAQAVGEVGVEGDRVRAGDRLQEELQLRAERTVDVLPVASGHAAHRHSRQLETGTRGGETRVWLHDARHQPWLSAQLLHLHTYKHITVTLHLQAMQWVHLPPSEIHYSSDLSLRIK